jgi:hypothetical protein
MSGGVTGSEGENPGDGGVVRADLSSKIQALSDRIDYHNQSFPRWRLSVVPFRRPK